MSLTGAGASNAVPIYFVTAETWPEIQSSLPAASVAFAKACGFEPAPGRAMILPDAEGKVASVLFGLEKAEAKSRDLLLPGRLANSLPTGGYRFANHPYDLELATLSWMLASYRFGKYKSHETHGPELVPSQEVDMARVSRIAEAMSFGRDLINTPANDLGPDALEAAALKVSSRYGGKATVTRGEKLLQTNFPLIHAVGRAAEKAPRLVDFSWGNSNDPKVTLVGKGVCFDSGGLDIKPGSAMALMKKDMGGAATAMALAAMIMDGNLKLRLRVLIPIVENAISANAFRPGDVYPSRKGLTVEIGNTDAEGRLILADALTFADEDSPELLLDFATLTGAARVALGPDLPAFYTMDDELATEISRYGMALQDPVWRMPLWDPYDRLIDSKVADMNNISGGSFAGSITAALFLRRFVTKCKSWAHFDIYGWTPSAKSASPEGGEIQVARLLYDLLEDRYGAGPGVEAPAERPRRIVMRLKEQGPFQGLSFDDLANLT
jgi:leucyl aminopeptidase